MTSLTMYDSTDLSALPADGSCFAGYVDGAWPTYATIRARFPHARVLSIAVFATGNAECLDIETGDAAPVQAAIWVRRQQARGVHRPAIYTSVSNVGIVIGALASAGISRAEVRLWSAHYGCGQHICGPSTCMYIGPDGRVVTACDGTQWTDTALSRNLDQSVLVGDFFDTPAPPKPPVEADMPGIWEQIISVTPVFTAAVITGWVVAGIGVDGELWTTTKTGAKWSAPERIDTIDIRA